LPSNIIIVIVTTIRAIAMGAATIFVVVAVVI
jgi:hypothetical protein